MKLDKSARTTDVIGLSKYTGYEFQILAFTFIGDGPNSTVKSKRTKEDGKKLILMIGKFNKAYFIIISPHCGTIERIRP